jgi:Flp pilus assembly pilin Flp
MRCRFAILQFGGSSIVMINYVGAWSGLVLDRRAVTALEYAIIAGVIVATLVIGFNVFADALSNKFNTVAAGI